MCTETVYVGRLALQQKSCGPAAENFEAARQAVAAGSEQRAQVPPAGPSPLASTAARPKPKGDDDFDAARA